jgi:hypothetical protein
VKKQLMALFPHGPFVTDDFSGRTFFYGKCKCSLLKQGKSSEHEENISISAKS